ncbi:MAG: hypothetical protein KGH61_02930 [Candidatus Micrarchaeota archaeon]|nr:hypothetical protein [Candidatus Micrarchaeota archaeon]MDE1847877.1 hypothetical protein [Candidatus Micrarchaeota archaeon]MDE1864204.1 hypothetical protein [Candidatus Micrarchaeota archaeon]
MGSSARAGMAKNGADADPEKDFDWELHPNLERFVLSEVNRFLNSNSFAKELSEKMLVQTSTKFIDWIDHISLPESAVDLDKLRELGLREWKCDAKPDNSLVLKHPRSYLFPILIADSKYIEISIKPESIDDFSQALGKNARIQGAPFSEFRKATLSSQHGTVFSAVERRGYDGFITRGLDDVGEYLEILSLFFNRPRNFVEDSEGLGAVEELISDSVKRLDNARVSDAFFRAERPYWQRRNRAGQIQKLRQDSLGLGWGNHDHHTYRSSRENFTRMISVFESMGYSCREKYYAGEKAGWGAQILEHSKCNIVVFTDVDLEANETSIDFSHKGLKEKEKKLGTVGLWVGLHGESILQAGMHHLEARFDFERLSTDLPKFGINLMPPFSHFDFLKQAFTAGEVWKVDKKRLGKLLRGRYITKAQYDVFAQDGALGSHMENLERDQGFKGFNRSSVTKIILETDPRKQHFTGV